jgi:hypothetical protein
MYGSRKRARKSQRCVGFPWNPPARGYHLENLEDGLSIEEIIEQFDVTREQVTAVLDFIEPISPATLGCTLFAFTSPLN